MLILANTKQLIDYKKRLERQKDILEISSVFSISEKKELLQIYCNLIAICENRIEYRNKIVNDITTL